MSGLLLVAAARYDWFVCPRQCCVNLPTSLSATVRTLASQRNELVIVVTLAATSAHASFAASLVH